MPSFLVSSDALEYTMELLRLRLQQQGSGEDLNLPLVLAALLAEQPGGAGRLKAGLGALGRLLDHARAQHNIPLAADTLALVHRCAACSLHRLSVHALVWRDLCGTLTHLGPRRSPVVLPNTMRTQTVDACIPHLRVRTGL